MLRKPIVFSKSVVFIILFPPGDKYVCIYDMATLQAVQKFAFHGSYVGCCAFNRDSSLLATGSNDKTVAIWQFSSKDGAIQQRNIINEPATSSNAFRNVKK